MRLSRTFFIFITIVFLMPVLASVTGAATLQEQLSQKQGTSTTRTTVTKTTVTKTIKKNVPVKSATARNTATKNVPAKPAARKTAVAKKAAAAPSLSVEKIRYGVNGDKTRIVIELDRRADWRVFTMGRATEKTGIKPWRVIVDLPPSSFHAPKNERITTRSLLRQYRSGVLEEGGLTRIIFDLSNPAIVSSAFFIPKDSSGRDRLVIDLQPATQKLFDSKEKQVVGNINLGGAAVSALSPDMPKMNEQPADDNSAADDDVIERAVTATTVKTTTDTPVPNRRGGKYIVVIDAGHGGEDPGALGYGGIQEKNITLSIARELGRQLEATGRYRAVFTRDHDVYIKLFRRVDISREKNADVFISIHADKTDKINTRGASIYTLSNTASDAQTEKLAEEENNSGVVAGVDLSVESHDVAGILLDLAMREKMNESNLLARYLVGAFGSNGVPMLPNSHRSAGFAVLKAPDVPSVLIETGFVSNPEEAGKLTSARFQSQIAGAIVAGVDDYFHKIQVLQKD